MTWKTATFALAAPLVAADWPEWRGAGRRGEWRETGILERFPESGLKVRWRTPIKSGFAGPAVAGGRVFVIDADRPARNRAIERAVALDEATGRVLWIREWPADYGGLAYGTGPRATPTVDGDLVYVLGAKGMLKCLRVADGAEVWSRDFVTDFRTVVPGWGMTSAPVVHKGLLVAVVGGAERAKVVAFDKRTGKEAWRALESDTEPGYSAPVLVDGKLVVWHASALAALKPDDGEMLWEAPFNARMGLAVATPVWSGRRMLTSSFYTGPMLVDTDTGKMLWKGSSQSEIQTDKLHALVNTPVIDGDHIYGICSYGQMRCLDLRTGERVWESLEATGEKARWSTGMLVRQGDRYFLNNDKGELVICRLSPKGYQEVSRTRLIKPTTTEGIGRRQAGAVNWSHPAYANRHVVARNDEEILSAALY
jgi:outer membrane protein assembly factor BamB